MRLLTAQQHAVFPGPPGSRSSCWRADGNGDKSHLLKSRSSRKRRCLRKELFTQPTSFSTTPFCWEQQGQHNSIPSPGVEAASAKVGLHSIATRSKSRTKTPMIQGQTGDGPGTIAGQSRWVSAFPTPCSPSAAACALVRDLRGCRGAVTAIQRFGSALDTQVHFHSLVVQDVFVENEGGTLRFVPSPAPSDAEVARLLSAVRPADRAVGQAPRN